MAVQNNILVFLKEQRITIREVIQPIDEIDKLLADHICTLLIAARDVTQSFKPVFGCPIV
jgi:hypothetical protein